MRKVALPNQEVVAPTFTPVAQTHSSEPIDIFSVNVPNYTKKYVERKRENKFRELINLFDKSSLRKALDVLEEEELIKKINFALRERGINTKLRKKHITIIKQLLSE